MKEVRKEEVKLRGAGGGRFVKQVGFKPGVKERGSYGWAGWWIKKRKKWWGKE